MTCLVCRHCRTLATRAHPARASSGMTASHQENRTKMRFNGPSIERLSKDNLWPSALTPPILPAPLFVTGHLSNPVRWSDYGPFWKRRLHASRIRTSSFQQLYMTTNHWIVAGRRRNTSVLCSVSRRSEKHWSKCSSWTFLVAVSTENKTLQKFNDTEWFL